MNLLKAFGAVSSMTLVSRVTGLLRDTIQASIFGAGLTMDAFVVASRIPNLLRRLFAEGAFAQAFVPTLAEYKTKRGHEETHVFVDHIGSLLAIILFIVTLIGVIAAPLVVYLTAQGFTQNPDKFALTVDLLRICFPYIFFIALVSFTSGILNTHSHFKVPAFTPVFLNLSFIGFALFAVPYFDPPIKALAWAMFVGGVLQLAFQIPSLMKLKMLPRFRPVFNDPGVWRVLKLMGPAVIGVSVAQISQIINTFIASFFANGSVSWLYYADRLMEFPNGMLGAALGTILLPSLAKHHANNNVEEYSKLLDWGLRITVMLTLPAALALALISVPLITSLFHYGQFSVNDVYMTRLALIAYSAGLTGMLLVKILAPGFYARQNVRTPVKIAMLTLAATQLMNLIFIFGFKMNHEGLALAIGLGACVNAGFLYWKLRTQNIYHPQPGWGIFTVKLLVALAAMGAALWFAMGADALWLNAKAHEKLLRLTFLVTLGSVIYLAALWLMGFRMKDFAKKSA
jgi:putative peptidoglycan lipid II flippase